MSRISAYREEKHILSLFENYTAHDKLIFSVLALLTPYLVKFASYIRIESASYIIY